MSDFFKFENKDFDFPFYNGVPKLNAVDWVIFLLGSLLFAAIILLPFSIDGNVFAILSCLVCLIPILYVSRGNLKLFFRMPESSNIKLIILCFIIYFAYSIAMVILFEHFGFLTVSNPVFGIDMDITFFVSSAVQLMGEELYKIIVLIFVIFLAYRFTNKRKLAIVCGVIVSLLSFGLLHLPTYNYNVGQCVFIIGLGGLFYLYAYLKTKNVIVSYLIHILIDFVPFVLSMIIN